MAETFRDMCTRLALAHDTAMSRAMLRALGVDVPHRARVGSIVRVDRYAEVRECFANRRRVNL